LGNQIGQPPEQQVLTGGRAPGGAEIFSDQLLAEDSSRRPAPTARGEQRNAN